MPKNIVICGDGTGNEFNPQSNSNLLKLCSTLVINQDQASYDYPGVGTVGAPTAERWWEKQWTRIKGLAFGAGFFEDVGRAYQRLMDHYLDGSLQRSFGRRADRTRPCVPVRIQPRALNGARPGQVAENVWTAASRQRGANPPCPRMFERRHKENQRALLDEAKQFQEIFSRPRPVHFAGLSDTLPILPPNETDEPWARYP